MSDAARTKAREVLLSLRYDPTGGRFALDLRGTAQAFDAFAAEQTAALRDELQIAKQDQAEWQRRSADALVRTQDAIVQRDQMAEQTAALRAELAQEKIRADENFRSWERVRQKFSDHVNETAALRAALNEPFISGSRVTNCVRHINLSWDQRPLESCRLCLTDLRNHLAYCVHVNAWLNERLEAARALLAEPGSDDCQRGQYRPTRDA